MLDERNFQAWSSSLKVALAGRGKLKWLSGGPPKPKASEKDELLQWTEESYQVLGMIQCSMEPRVFEEFMRYDSVTELWEALKRSYGTTRVHARVYAVLREVTTAAQGDRSVHDYFRWIQGRLLELADLEPLSGYECTKDANLARDQRKARETYFFLMGLRPEFEPVRSRIVSMTPLPMFLMLAPWLSRRSAGCRS